MVSTVVAESYVMATGYAALMGACGECQHLFARAYGQPVGLDVVKSDWKEFSETRRRNETCLPKPVASCTLARVGESCPQPGSSNQ